MSKVLPHSQEDLISFLEENFQVYNYDMLENASLVAWANLLMMRRIFLIAYFDEESSDLKQSFLAHILAYPVQNLVAKKELILRPTTLPGVVADLNFIDIIEASLNSQVDEYRKTLFAEYLQQLSSVNAIDRLKSSGHPKPDDALYESFHSFLLRGDPSPTDSLAFASVNLQATDDQLTEAFSVWLQEKRAELKHSGRAPSPLQKFSAKSLESWHKNRALGYLDLRLFENHFETTIPNHIKGKLLFPDEYNVDLGERIRKVVKPLADKLINIRTIETLNLAAEKEIADSRNQNE